MLLQVSVVLAHPSPSASVLGGFEGVLSVDASSNRRLALTLFNVAGTVAGRVPAGDGSQFTFQASRVDRVTTKDSTLEMERN